ncbi:coat protein [ssRNA phage Gerhypos.2_39]|uniref:Coat protein n=2 Tax=Leviviricetes TaxID=2842243 RepID=A0A8S5L3F8_9VIRU|nr:coat protein [ssRNA phage Gerhypos.2_39]QDH89565.1 MAG: hypothetical protein H2Bulk3672_000003 [Leviviridae sp.]DAD52201.1 TPA_asm: coat protein [ssRNA phage Gerhypos.2_39]
MALTDPQSITISAVTSPLPRTFAEGDESHYTSADGLIQLSVNHSLAKGNRARRLVRLDHSKLTADPFRPSENVKVTSAIYLVFDLPPAGYTAAEVLAVYTGFKTLYTASSDALITKVLGGES